MERKLKIICLIDVFRPTTDEWYPCYPDRTVRIRVTRLTNGKWRVSVWGADDFGMEIDVERKRTATKIYKALPAIITQKGLLALGFKRA